MKKVCFCNTNNLTLFQAQKRKKSKHKGGEVETVVNGNTPTSCDNNRSLPNHPSSNTASAQSLANQPLQGNKNPLEKQSDKPRPSPQGSSSPAAPPYVDNRTVITATINPKSKVTNKNQGCTPGVVELNAKQAQQHLHEQIIEQITKQKQQELLKQQQALIQLKVQEEVQKQLRNQAQKLQQQLQQPQQQKQQQSAPNQQLQTPGQQQQKQQQSAPIQQKQQTPSQQQSAPGQKQQQKANLNANMNQKPLTTQSRPPPNSNPQNNASNANTNSPNKTKKSGNPRVESPASKVKEQNNNVKINNKVLQPQLNNIISQAQQSVQNQASQGKKSRTRQEELIEERIKAVSLAQSRNPTHPAPPPAYNSHFGQPVQNSTVIQNGTGSPVKVQKQERPAPQGQARSGDTTPRKQDPGRGKQEDSPPSDQGRNPGSKNKKMKKKSKGTEDINFIGEWNDSQFIYFLFGFYGPSRLFLSFWAKSVIRWGENGRSLRKTTESPASRTLRVSHEAS